MKNYKFLLYVTQNYSFAVLRPIQKELNRQGFEMRWFLVGDSINRNYLKANESQLSTLRAVRDYKPDIVFVPNNIVPSFIPGLKVELFHGFNVGKRADHKGHFNIRGCFDLYCTQGPNTTEKFQQLAAQYGYFEARETGWPMLDPLFANNDKTPVFSNDKPTILFCSTFSKNLTCAPHLFEEIKRLRENDNWNWIVQFHPKMAPEIVANYKAIQSDNLKFIETDNVIPLLQEADIMLCDTSSILLMFILQNKPVVTFRNNRPGEHLVNVTEVNEIAGAIKHALIKPDDLMQKITDFNTQLHPYTDGKSSERVINASIDLLQNKHRLMKKKPLNIIKNIKQTIKLSAQF